MKRLHLGRLTVYIEPRDIWVGIYVARDAVYICPLPLLVFKWNTTACEYEQHDECIGCSCYCHGPAFELGEAPF